MKPIKPRSPIMQLSAELDDVIEMGIFSGIGKLFGRGAKAAEEISPNVARALSGVKKPGIYDNLKIMQPTGAAPKLGQMKNSLGERVSSGGSFSAPAQRTDYDAIRKQSPTWGSGAGGLV